MTKSKEQKEEELYKEKKDLAVSMIPKGARRLMEKDYEEFKNSLVAGWLCDSQCVEYGICDGRNGWDNSLSMPLYKACVTWEPTLEETMKYLGRNKLADTYSDLEFATRVIGDQNAMKLFISSNSDEMNIKFKYNVCIVSVRRGSNTYTSPGWDIESKALSGAIEWIVTLKNNQDISI